MREELLNDYFRIVPLEHEQFIVNEKTSYEEIGKIVNMPAFWAKEHPEWMGGTAYFDSYICKRYPNPNKSGEAEWFVPLSEIVKIDIPDAA